jgi:hypothetical protein
MNISVNEFETNAEMPVKFRHRAGGSKQASSDRKNPSFGRRKKGPQQFNGIHRRRKKKIRW